MSSIDVTEILNSVAGHGKEGKRRRLDETGGEKRAAAEEVNADELRAAVEGAQEMPVLDEQSVKRLVLNLEKRNLKNRELRIKHGDEPEKFMESESDLNVAIQEMHIIATQPDLYDLLVEHGAIKTFLQLLSHENTDICSAVIHLLQELTDVEILGESDREAASVVDSLLSGQLIGNLVQSLDRMDETNKDEADAVSNALAIVENMMDFRPETADLCVDQGVFGWLLKRIGQKSPFDGNKLYSSELLGMIMQATELARKALTEKQDGCDILLRALSSYKRHDPTSNDEREYMENLFDCLCVALMYTPNRRKFLHGEGLQLMNLMLREKKESRESALKVIDYATNGPEGKDNCDKFIEILGLRTLFPLFMLTPNKSKRKDTSADEHEEHVCAIISSLLKSCSEANRTRVLGKFSEQDFAKVDRLIELHLRYAEKVKRWEASQDESKTDKEAAYLDKLDCGLFTWQLVALILSDVSIHSSRSCRDRATKLLNMKGGSLKDVRNVLVEYRDNLGAEASAEVKRVSNLIDRLLA